MEMASLNVINIGQRHNHILSNGMFDRTTIDREGIRWRKLIFSKISPSERVEISI